MKKLIFILATASVFIFSEYIFGQSTNSANAIVITNRHFCDSTISPFQYGQFVEYCGDLVPGIWADKLDDLDFEGSTGAYGAYNRPWYGSGDSGRYSFDHSSPFSGSLSGRVQTIGGSTPCTVGCSQDWVAVDPADSCTLSVYLKQTNIAGTVTVTVHNGSVVLGSCQFSPVNGAAWQKYSAVMTFSAKADSATLTISYQGPGTLLIDDISLMPASAIGGWRKDVVDALRAAKPGIMRFGGTFVDYPPQWGAWVGNKDMRQQHRDGCGSNINQPKGAGLEEIVNLFQLANADPLICIGLPHATPDSAAAEVEYFNGAVTTPMGALRAQNGHPQPYNIKYWELGNELSGTDTIIPEYARAMKAKDPTIHLLGGSYPDAAMINVDSVSKWIGYVSPHEYFNTSDDQSYLCYVEQSHCNSYRSQFKNAPSASGKRLKLSITEWNITGGGTVLSRMVMASIQGGFYAARMHSVYNRNSDVVGITNRSNLANCASAGFIQIEPSGFFKTPVYYAQQLFATHAGTIPLVIKGVDTTHYIGVIDSIDFSATISADQKKVTLIAVNFSRTDRTEQLDFSAFGTTGQPDSVWSIKDRDNAKDSAASNTFADPQRIVTTPGIFNAPATQFSYLFPNLSITAFEWKVNWLTSANFVNGNSASALLVSPNPSNGVFKIYMNNVQLPVDNYQLSIYNVMGEKVYSSIINNQSSVINLNVPNGAYFLQLKSGQGIATKKLIINK